DVSGNYDLQPSGSISLLKNTDITGNLTVSGSSTFTGQANFNGNVVLGDAAGDTLSIASSSITFSQFTNGGAGCSALETNASGLLVCGTDDGGAGGGISSVGTFSTTNTAAGGATISGSEIIFQ